MSDSVTPVLNQLQSQWFGGTLYDQTHPDDVEKLRDQLSTAENAMTGTAVSVISAVLNIWGLPAILMINKITFGRL